MRETDEQIEAMRGFRALRREWLWFKFILAVRRCLADGTLKAGYNPNQPRGNDGRWGGGGDARVERVANRSVRPIDILEEDRKGGHIFELHVNKSHHFLIQRVIASRYVNTDLIQVGENGRARSPLSKPQINSSTRPLQQIRKKLTITSILKLRSVSRHFMFFQVQVRRRDMRPTQKTRGASRSSEIPTQSPS